MFAYSWLASKVSSQKSQAASMFGSEGLVTDGSASAGPGLIRKVSGAPTENHTRPPAIRGTVISVVEPGAPSRIAQSTATGAPTPGGDEGKYAVLPSARRRNRAFPLSIA